MKRIDEEREWCLMSRSAAGEIIGIILAVALIVAAVVFYGILP